MAATFVNKDWKEVSRTPCEVYTRVMGYLRPVSNYQNFILENILKRTR